MKLERRIEAAKDRDQELHHQLPDHASQPREPVAPETMRLEPKDDPFRGMSDGDVLQRLEWM
jgi:hypothetical protein